MEADRPTPKKEFSSMNSTGKSADYGPSERWAHSPRILEPTDTAGLWVARALETDLLDRLMLENVIAARHKEAALRLRADFQAAGLGAHLASSYNPARSAFSYFSGWDERSEAEEEAYRRWRKAVEAIGPMFSDCVISAVCYDAPLPPQKYVLLTVGLVKLMRWYGSNKHVDETAARQRAARHRGTRDERGR